MHEHGQGGGGGHRKKWIGEEREEEAGGRPDCLLGPRPRPLAAVTAAQQ